MFVKMTDGIVKQDVLFVIKYTKNHSPVVGKGPIILTFLLSKQLN